MMSRTCPSGLGPSTSGPVRQRPAASRIALICSTVNAWRAPFGRRNGLVPCTGFRGIASCRRAKPKSWLRTVREWCAREGDTALAERRNHSTRPVVISPSEKCSNCGRKFARRHRVLADRARRDHRADGRACARRTRNLPNG